MIARLEIQLRPTSPVLTASLHLMSPCKPTGNGRRKCTNKTTSERRLLMRVSDLMTRSVECISPDATLQEAAAKMKSLDIGPLPVCDNDRLVGMITDRDITVRATAEGEAPTDIRVRHVMTPEIIYCFEDALVGDAALLMQQKQVRRLLVLNRDKRLVGIVSLGDLAVDTRDEELAGATLQAVSEPAEPRR